MILRSFCFGQVFVSEILIAQTVCFLLIDWIVPIVMRVPINAGEMKTFEKSQMYSRVHIHTKLKEMMVLPSRAEILLYECINELLIPKSLQYSLKQLIFNSAPRGRSWIFEHRIAYISGPGSEVYRSRSRNRSRSQANFSGAGLDSELSLTSKLE